MTRYGCVLLAATLIACTGESDVDSGTSGTDSGPAITGCASMGGPMCPTGQMCCSGVPYPTDGLCQSVCDMRSDRHAKDRVASIDQDAVLEQLLSLEIREWSYREDPQHARHVGPMSQDFHRTFGVGGDDTVISQVDADGVLMASMQALHRRVEALASENERLREQNRDLEARVGELEAR